MSPESTTFPERPGGWFTPPGCSVAHRYPAGEDALCGVARVPGLEPWSPPDQHSYIPAAERSETCALCRGILDARWAAMFRQPPAHEMAAPAGKGGAR